MKAVSIALAVVSVAVASTAYVLRRSAPQPVAHPVPVEVPVVAEHPVFPEPVPTNAVKVNDDGPVQSLEDRGDAMLFEIDALQSMPFDEPIVRPFD